MSSITGILLDMIIVRPPMAEGEEVPAANEFLQSIFTQWEEYPGWLAATMATTAEAAIFKSMAFMHLVRQIYNLQYLYILNLYISLFKCTN